MKNVTQHFGKLHVVKRMASSKNGNPRYLCNVDGWTCRTRPNSTLGFEVKNMDGRMVKAYIGTHYTVATLIEAELV